MSSSSGRKLSLSRKNKRKTDKTTPTEPSATPAKGSPALDPADRRVARPGADKPALVKTKGLVFDPAKPASTPDPGRTTRPSGAPGSGRTPLTRRAAVLDLSTRNPRTPGAGPVPGAGGVPGAGLMPGSAGIAGRRLLLGPKPGVVRTVPAEIARDLQDIAATANAAEVGSGLEAERTRLEKMGSVMSADKWAAATRKFSERVGEIKKVLPDVLGLVGDLPLRRAEILGQLMAVNGAGDAAEVRKYVQKERSDATSLCALTVDTVEGATSSELSALSLDDKLMMLEDLRGGAGYADQDRRKAAMAKLYLQTELDRAFTDEDDRQRADALNRIRSVLQDDDRKWTTMTQADRLTALERALEIQSTHMGLPKDEWPKIAIGANMTRRLPTGEIVTLGGVFNQRTRTIEVSGEKLESFDRILDTVIHENTHNHQRWLVTQLEQGAIKKDDPRYRQVALFALNQGVGYHKGGSGTGLLSKADDDSAYEKQPTELHAHRAGAEAARTFKENANVRAADVMRRIDEWVRLNPGDPRRDKVSRLKDLPQQGLATGVASNILHLAVDSAERDFSTLTTPVPVTTTSPPTTTTPAPIIVSGISARSDKDKLVAEIDEWLANNPGSSKTSQLQDIRTQVAGANSRQLGVLRERFGMLSSN